jgi:hypothetical protein
MKRQSAILLKYWQLNILQIKNSSSFAYIWIYVPLAFLVAIVGLSVRIGFNENVHHGLNGMDGVCQNFLSMYKKLIFIILTIQYCSFLESDMSSGMMFHRYSLGFKYGQQSFLYAFYLMFFTLIYHLLSFIFVSIRLASVGENKYMDYVKYYGLSGLPNECVRTFILGILITYIYLNTRKSTLTFLWFFLIWVVESFLIVIDQYTYSWDIDRYLPIHAILSYDLFTSPISNATLIVLSYTVILVWLFYKSIKYTKETIVLNHFK